MILFLPTRFLMRQISLLVFFSVLGTLPLPAIKGDLLTIQRVEYAGHFEIQGHNSSLVPMVVHVEIESQENLQLEPSGTVQTILPPGQSKTLISATPLSKDLPWSKEFHSQFCPGNPTQEPDASVRYRIPYPGNVPRMVVSGPGSWPNHRALHHWGFDFELPIGTEVHAARGGLVFDLESRHQLGGPARWLYSLSNFVFVLHEDGTHAAYHHLRYGGVAVKVGDRIQTGDLLGYSGQTGLAPEPHLHFSVYRARADGFCESIPIRFDNGTREGLEVIEDMLLPVPIGQVQDATEKHPNHNLTNTN